jgi:putative chitinase
METVTIGQIEYTKTDTGWRTDLGSAPVIPHHIDMLRRLEPDGKKSTVLGAEIVPISNSLTNLTRYFNHTVAGTENIKNIEDAKADSIANSNEATALNVTASNDNSLGGGGPFDDIISLLPGITSKLQELTVLLPGLTVGGGGGGGQNIDSRPLGGNNSGLGRTAGKLAFGAGLVALGGGGGAQAATPRLSGGNGLSETPSRGIFGMFNRPAPAAAGGTPAPDSANLGQVDESQLANLTGVQGVILAAAREQGLTNPYVQAALLANIEKESNFVPGSENLNYTTPSRLSSVFTTRVRGREQQLVRNPVGLANVVYGNRMGNGPESSGDGWNFRGRGFIQLTGRDNYTRYGRELGVDLVGDPNQAMNPVTAARIAARFVKNGLGNNTNFTNQAQANRAVTQVIGGSRLNLNRGIGAEILGKVNRFSTRYTASSMASMSRAQYSGPQEGEQLRTTQAGGAAPVSSASTAAIEAVIVKNNPRVKIEGLHPVFKSRMLGFARDFQAATGRKIQVNSGFRSYADQAALFRQIGSPGAARPGRSLHEGGLAFDMQSTHGEQAERLGLFRKWRLSRPIPSERWHVTAVEGRNFPVGDNPAAPGRPVATPDNTRVPPNANSRLPAVASTAAVDRAVASVPTRTVVPSPQNQAPPPQVTPTFRPGTRNLPVQSPANQYRARLAAA